MCLSFSVATIVHEDDLVCTHASPSPLPQLSSGFGIHLSSLNRLNASDGSFKLSGYVSDINSRFVSKGPIHKLLNNITMSFHSSCDIEKRSKSQIYPLFLLNLNCPRSLYDSTLEPSKTSVEFKESLVVTKWFLMLLVGSGEESLVVTKWFLMLLVGRCEDWHPVLLFIEDTVTNLWTIF